MENCGINQAAACHKVMKMISSHSILTFSRCQKAGAKMQELGWNLKKVNSLTFSKGKTYPILLILFFNTLPRRQRCSYEGSSRRQRISIQSCIPENKRPTRVITKRAATKTFRQDSFFFRTCYASGKITTADCICNNYRTTNNKKWFTRKSVKILSFYSKVTSTFVSLNLNYCFTYFKQLKQALSGSISIFSISIFFLIFFYFILNKVICFYMGSSLTNRPYSLL